MAVFHGCEFRSGTRMMSASGEFRMFRLCTRTGVPPSPQVPAATLADKVNVRKPQASASAPFSKTRLGTHKYIVCYIFYRNCGFNLEVLYGFSFPETGSKSSALPAAVLVSARRHAGSAKSFDRSQSRACESPRMMLYGNRPYADFVLLEPLILDTWDSVGRHLCQSWCRHNQHLNNPQYNIVSAMVLREHWIPLWFVPHGHVVQCHVLHDDVSIDAVLRPILEEIAHGLNFAEFALHVIPTGFPDNQLCGPIALTFLRHVMYGHWMPGTIRELRDEHTEFRASFVAAMYTNATCFCPVVWGWGSNDLVSELAFELVKHGVPPDRAENRASMALKAIGSDPVQKALAGKQTWRQLKSLANEVKFQFIQHDELAASIANNSKGDVNKAKKSAKALRVPQQPPDLVLDPSKLQVMPGVFVCGTSQLEQLSPQQIGPVSSGFVLMSASEAEPSLSLRRPQSSRSAVDLWKKPPKIPLESLDVATIKVLVYRDELAVEWSDFISSPIRHLVSKCPILKKCTEPNCTCAAWHNEEMLPVRDVLLDVWRRQFLKSSFKPEQASKAEIFSVCLRLPACILTKVLSLSGNSGIYFEARTEDGRETMSEFAVVWTPKTNAQELNHLRQTNPGVLGLVRIGDRRGLRVPASQASAIHALVRPDTMYLPVGPRKTFLVGPFPYGCDRHAISRARKKASWEAKPLQPSAPVAGKGNVWLVQSIDEPPASMFHTTHGEVIITRHRDEPMPKHHVPKPVGAASTLALRGGKAPLKTGESDPWSKTDPWSSWQPTMSTARGAVQATESLKQLETRIFDAVVDKLPTSAPMDEDFPDRLQVLEGQVQQLMTKHQKLEHSMAEHSNHQGQQIANLQNQITTQGQQFHGQLASQEQSIAAMFETQMSQIRSLLSKRPHESLE
eukprot:s3822_g4.t1